MARRQRFLGFPQSQKEVVARSDCDRASAAGTFDYLYRELRARSFYLHSLLDGYSLVSL